MDQEKLAKAMFLAYYREEDDAEVWDKVEEFVKETWRQIAASVLRQLQAVTSG